MGSRGTAIVKIAGGNLAQPTGDSITVSGIAEVTICAGQEDSCGQAAPAQPIQSRLPTMRDGYDALAGRP